MPACLTAGGVRGASAWRAAEMIDKTVIIVGGGPAGASCARQLKAAGLDVLILDKKQFP
ncbi:MAG TPA: FAD-dependent oxidoreductase, partial [Desulfosalsimonadaceae bacterium]|nr:FAD-dependent oxidoreductase [Desulfosalsimonadaceae bacterium]